MSSYPVCECCQSKHPLGRFEIQIISDNGEVPSDYIQLCESCLKELSLWCNKHARVPSLIHSEGDLSKNGARTILTACGECIADKINKMTTSELAEKASLLGLVLTPDMLDFCTSSKVPETLRKDLGAHELFMVMWAAELQKDTFDQAVTAIVSSTCAHA